MKCTYKLAAACLVSGWLLSALGTCYANLGDGPEAAKQRWGEPTLQEPAGDGIALTYHSNGWVIQQFYSAAGLAEVVRYYKPAVEGKWCNFFTKEERNAIWLANTSGEGNVHWTYLPKSTATQQMWYSSECNTVVHIETVLIGKQWLHCLIFSTVPDGVTLLQTYLHEPQNSPATVDPTVRQLPINEVTEFSTREHPLV